jgi:hypothetical protein
MNPMNSMCFPSESNGRYGRMIPSFFCAEVFVELLEEDRGKALRREILKALRCIGSAQLGQDFVMQREPFQIFVDL